jgi:hypothetical protein
LIEAGSPEGFVFPKASLVVRVTVMNEPEVTVELEALMVLWARS